MSTSNKIRTGETRPAFFAQRGNPYTADLERFASAEALADHYASSDRERRGLIAMCSAARAGERQFGELADGSTLTVRAADPKPRQESGYWHFWR